MSIVLLFAESDIKLTTTLGFIDLDESNSIGKEMYENHGFTFASDSTVINTLNKLRN